MNEDEELEQVLMWKSKNGTVWAEKSEAHQENLRTYFMEEYSADEIRPDIFDGDNYTIISGKNLFSWMMKHRDLVKEIVNHEWE